MSLAVGARLGPYEIVGRIGAGGMGEVYRARDTRLGRDVAVKALPASAALDADRVARFEQEARMLAALNHPHIAAIYGVEEAGGPGRPAPSQYLILELVEGGTLADRLASGPLPIRDVLVLALQVADALEAAHERGIVHRDLKPTNIALSRDGQAKVLDFGVAKATAVSPDAATAAAPATERGAIVGTAAYMSPEQARGLPVDKRSDIWSFGCVWFEALSRRHPFSAPTASDTVAAILGRDPDWAALPPDTPPRVTWLLRRCLEKDLRRRLHDIADARIELEEAIARPAEGAAPAADQSLALVRRIRRRERWAWTSATLAAAVAIGSWLVTRAGPTTAVDALALHASIVFPGELRLSVSEDPSARFALSPDGRRIAVVGVDSRGESTLWVRPLDGLVAQQLSGTEGANHPFWSPDSQAIGFIQRPTAEGLVGVQAKLRRVDLATGQVSTIGDVGLLASSTWNRDGAILFTPAGGSAIHRVAASGGASAPVTVLDKASGDAQHVHPFFLPDGRHFLYSVIGSRSGGAADPRGVYLASLDSPTPATLVIEGGTNAKFADGHVVFVRGGRLLAQPFDPGAMRLVPGSAPTSLAEGVQEAGGGGSAALSVSEAGVIAYQAVVPVSMQLGWFDRTGREIARLGDRADYADVALSGDGSRAAVSLLDPSAGTRDIWVFDVARGLKTRLTSHPADDFAPVWSPNGDRLVFSSIRQGRVDLYETSTAGVGGDAVVPAGDLDVGKFAGTWSADGRFLAFVAGGRVIARSDLWVLPLSGDRTPFALAASESIETQPRFSPDGRWILYTSNESGRLEVYARPFPGPGRREQISIDGGRYGLWRKDGSEVFFLSPDNQIMAAAVRIAGSALQVGAIRPLFRIQFRRIRLDAYPYASSPDGQRFLVNTVVDDAAPPAISLLVNWRSARR